MGKSKTPSFIAGPLEKGTDQIDPRPFREPIIERAMPRIKRIFQEPYG